MSTPHKQVKEFMTVMEQDRPLAPIVPPHSVRLLRCKLMLEELIETIKASGFALVFNEKREDSKGYQFDNPVELNMHNIQFDELHEPNLIELVDGLCDSEYVGFAGSAIAWGLSEECMAECFEEVHRSNMSKLWTSEELHSLIPWTTDKEHLEIEARNTFAWASTGSISDILKCKYVGCKHEFEQDEADYYCKHCKRDHMEIHAYDRPWLVKDSSGKVIKSPSYSPANLEPIIKRYQCST